MFNSERKMNPVVITTMDPQKEIGQLDIEPATHCSRGLYATNFGTRARVVLKKEYFVLTHSQTITPFDAPGKQAF